jgi:peptidoglycan/LPS O-acetylase OafA/YrhL
VTRAAETESTPRSSRLAAIDALRGVAVLSVLISHVPFSMNTARQGALAESPFPAWVAKITDHGRFGVHLFLVLSGFCIHMAWARKKDDGPLAFGAFWRRRLHRLYPPYFVALLASVAGLYALHSIFGGQTGTIASRLGYSSSSQLAADLILLVLLAQNVNGSSRRIGNEPFWTLALEEQLYALYFPLLWMRRKWGWTRALVVVSTVTLLWRTLSAYLAPADWIELFRVGPARWFEWTLGALAVEAHLGRVTLPKWCRSAPIGVLLLAIAVSVYNLPGLGVALRHVMPLVDSLFGMALFVLVNFACSKRWVDVGSNIAGRFFAWVGTFSYSLYLTHVLIMFGAKQIALRAGLGVTGTLVARVVLPIGVAWLFYVVVERRFLNASRATSGHASKRTPVGRLSYD